MTARSQLPNSTGHRQHKPCPLGLAGPVVTLQASDRPTPTLKHLPECPAPGLLDTQSIQRFAAPKETGHPSLAGPPQIIVLRYVYGEIST